MIVDAHLDMAGNVLAGKDYDAPATGNDMVTLTELRAGGVAVAFGTLFTGTVTFDADGNGVYPEPPDVGARRQLDVYRAWEDDGKARIVRDRRSLEAHLEAWRTDGVLGIVILVEGGDSITTPDDLPAWFEAGVRIVGPAWSGTRYCGGTKRPGGLTPMGRDLVAAMRDLGVVLDASHLAERSFWDAIEFGPGRICATHSNARALVPDERPLHGRHVLSPDRHLTDDMVAAIASLDGIIGLNLYNAFLHPTWQPGDTVTLDAVRAHAEHIAALAGWHRVGIGSDLDGGLGRAETPVELETAADLGRVGEAAPPEARAGLLADNWLRFLRSTLPA